MRSRDLAAVLATVAALVAPPPAWRAGGRPRAPATRSARRCRAALPWLRGPRCPRCALPAPCGRALPGGAAARSRARGRRSRYEGPAPRARARAEVPRRAARSPTSWRRRSSRARRPALLDGGVALVPVPTHPRAPPARAASTTPRVLARGARRADRACRRAVPAPRGARRRARPALPRRAAAPTAACAWRLRRPVPRRVGAGRRRAHDRRDARGLRRRAAAARCVRSIGASPTHGR